jgi:WD40 repeat protein
MGSTSENYKELAKLEGQKDIVGLAFDKTGETLATAGRDGTTVIWDVKTRKEKTTLKSGPGAMMGGMVYSDDGKTVVTKGPFVPIVVWDVEKEQPRLTYENPKKGVQLLNGVSGLALSPDGKMLVFTTTGGFVRWIPDLEKGAPIETAEELRVPDSGSYPVAFSPDGKLIAVAANKMVKIGAVPEKKKE